MPRVSKIASLVILIGALGSPVYAAEHTATPPAPDAAPGMMQEGGDTQGTGMEGMMGMMNMMEQMNKMMALCTKMMEGMMSEMDQQSGPAETP